MSLYISHGDVVEAYDRIQSHVENTPLIHSRTFSGMSGCTTLFKLENLQMTGSFKERGAVNRLLQLTDEEKARGIIAASAGNHAQALAYHGSRLGIPVKIVMPRYSPIVKVRSTEHWGAEVILEGDTFDDALAVSMAIVKQEKLTYVHPFDDPQIAAGQGTVGIELLASAAGSDIDAILVPVGGGGLISGIATYVKHMKPGIQVIGIEEENCTAMHQALQAGVPVLADRAPVIADGIAVRQVAGENLRIVNALVDDIVSVSSDEIANAIMLMLEIEKLVIEGSAATTLAALINNRLPQLKGKNVASVISGGNIDITMLSRVIDQGLTFDGRVARIETVVQDRPGNLETLLTVFRQSGANILEVNHHRLSPRAPIGQVGVSITVETRDKAHLLEIEAALTDQGYPLLD